jgi:hypothetical protein
MPSHKTLDKRIRAWLKVKQLGSNPVAPPQVYIPSFPDDGSVQLKDVPKLTASIMRLSNASMLGVSIPALASIMSVMERQDAEKLYNLLSRLPADYQINETLAASWFTLCHTLGTGIMGSAISGFFTLTNLHSVQKFELDLRSSLSLWYRLLRVSRGNNTSDILVSLKIAERFPNSFGLFCIRLASGGSELLEAVREVLRRIEQMDINRETGSYLLDFTIETGWFLEKADYDQIWNLILRRGNLVYGRLSGGLAPVSSIRFLSGLLRGIEETKGLDVLFSEERVHKAMEIFECASKTDIEMSFLRYPELQQLIDDQMEIDFVIESVSHGVVGSNISEIGYSIVVFIAGTQGGISLAKLNRFLKAIGEEVSAEVVSFLSRLVEDTDLHNRLSPSNLLRFSRIVSGILSVSTASDRTALKAFYRALTEMSHTDARVSTVFLDAAVFHSGISLGSVLSATSLLIRARKNENGWNDTLSRIASTGRLLEALSLIDRNNVLSGLVPFWIEAMLSFPAEVEKTVIDFVYRINDVSRRNRYLENVVAKLLQEVHPDDPVFRDCLAFAESGYNSSGSIEKLRDVEHRVFHKVLRAGNRIEAVDLEMADLLSLPGLESSKIEELISGIRLICDRFSRLAVWEEGADKIFKGFLEEGVSNILRAFVDNPGALEAVNIDIISELVVKLMPGETNSPNSVGVIDPGGTAQTFFGSILPSSIILFSREASALPEFLFEIADEFSRSMGGMAAGEDFARYIATCLDMEIVQDRVAILDAWLSQKTPPPFVQEENWSSMARAEWNGYRIREETTRMKLYGAVSALVGSAGSDIKEGILKTAGFLARELERAGIPGATALSLNWNRVLVDQLLTLSPNTSPYTLFAMYKSGIEPSPEVYSYLESIEGFMESDVFHAWRQTALPPLLNCGVEMLLASENSPSLAMNMARAAVNAMEFLGYNNSSSFLSTLQESFRYASSPGEGYDLMEKNFLLPLWKRNSAERLDLLLLGMKDSRLLLNILLERLSIEKRVEAKVRFMSNYATFFITVEKAILDIQSDSVRSRIVDALMESWLFRGSAPEPGKSVYAISEALELVQDVFRRIKYGGGIVTASEAGEISADMRRKYRDNADSVAIILRWTVDPKREDLLKLLEESQLLLQAAGTDTELMKLLDLHGARDGFVRDALPYSEDPAALKKFLQSLSANPEQE